MKVISEMNTNYLNSHTVDPLGRVFEYEGNIYRGIYKHQEGYFYEIWNSGVIQELIDKNLFPKAEIVNDLKHESYPILVKLEKIVYTDPTMWTFSMLKDAAITILKVQSVCNKYGYELIDGHLNNVSFKDTSAIFIDMGSITKIKNDVWRAKHEFIISTLLPLVLMQHGYLFDACMILISVIKVSLSFSDLTKTLAYKTFVEIMKSYGIENVFEFNFDEEWIANLLPVDNNHCKTIWTDYSLNDLNNFNEVLQNISSTRYRRILRIVELIDKFCPDANTIVDLGGNVGLTSLIIKSYTKRNISFINTDYDYMSIENSYNYFKQNKISKVQTYLLNCMSPITDNYMKLKSDIVLALALTHHLLLSQHRKIDEILTKIGWYTNKYVLVEFMPLGLWGGGDLPEVPSWYTQDWFKDNFQRYFELLHVEELEYQIIDSQKKAHRVIFIGEKKEIN